MWASLPAVLTLLLASAAAANTCGDSQHRSTDCARRPYNQSWARSADECCGLCAKEDGCTQWTYHGFSGTCARTKIGEPLVVGPSTIFSTCGVRSAPGPSPSPPSPPGPAPAPGKGSKWVVIAAGSQGFMNYRHQADACHAYQVAKKSGVPEDQIILMMQDDVASSRENPFRGHLYNKPGSDSPDVYDGCKVDYSGSKVTAKLFLSVITGDASGVPDGGKVLKSGKADRVFLNFVDHGGVGIVAFPNGPVLHSRELAQGLQTMQEKQMFAELVFYMEACESGSMFPGLKPDGKIFAVTASNARESSWGYYCMPKNDTVKGKHMGTCLGDLFSIAWMEDSDRGQLATESLQEQVRRVTARTTKSHVTTFGDTSFEQENIGRFELAVAGEPAAPAADVAVDPEGAVDIRDIPLRMAYYAWEVSAPGRERALAWDRLQKIVAARKADEELFAAIAKRSCEDAGFGCTYGILKSRHDMLDSECHQALARAIHDSCPARGEHNPGGWNEFNMQFSQALVNLCEAKPVLKKDTAALLAIVRGECASAAGAAAAGVPQEVVV